MPDKALDINETGGQDFVAAEDSITRRAVILGGLGLVGTAYAAAIGYPVYRYLATPGNRAAAVAAVTEVALKDAQKLPSGSVMMFRFGSHPAMLIHHKDGKWVALDAVCTHLGCTVQYTPEDNRIVCACHGGVYDSSTGANVSGPPPKPLTAYRVEVQDEQVIVSRA